MICATVRSLNSTCLIDVARQQYMWNDNTGLCVKISLSLFPKFSFKLFCLNDKHCFCFSCCRSNYRTCSSNSSSNKRLLQLLRWLRAPTLLTPRNQAILWQTGKSRINSADICHAHSLDIRQRFSETWNSWNYNRNGILNEGKEKTLTMTITLWNLTHGQLSMWP